MKVAFRARCKWTSRSVVDAGYMHHHLWSKTRQTGYSVGVTVRLESALSALDLAKKMERVKERRSSNHATKDHPEEITKNLHGRSERRNESIESGSPSDGASISHTSPWSQPFPE
ncbi:uncharacterized protein LOC141864448 isoform X2 [Acropora palmata]|uniref:uncharacterized protein LOC141864448 isoform X2 n=1 Tax=Acropora palmata TaxID=6131 RepID=UPI003DA04AF1